MDDFGFQTWNPFLFVSYKVGNRRGHEIHLPGYAPTNKVDILLFDSADDGSGYPTAGGGNLWYKTNVKAMASQDSVGQYFPWGLDIPGNFSYTIESDTIHQPVNGYYRHTIWWGYKKFKQWAGSNGTEALDWYSVNNSVYRDEDFIYSH
jgi:LruC domain-containing protein